MTVPSTIAHTVQQAQEWPKELRDDGDLDDEPARAEHIARRFASAWRPSCPEEAVGLGAQLPTILMLNLLPRPIAAERAITDLFALGAHHCDPGDFSGHRSAACGHQGAVARNSPNVSSTFEFMTRRAILRGHRPR
jgi:hypothetical protein